MQSQKDELQANLDTTNKYTKDMEAKVQRSAEVSQNLLQILRQRDDDAQKENLAKLEIVEQPVYENFERNYVYQFYKGDAIDMALAEFLNNY